MKKKGKVITLGFFLFGLLVGLGWGILHKQSGGVNQNGKVGMETEEKKEGKNGKEKDGEPQEVGLEKDKETIGEENCKNRECSRIQRSEQEYLAIENQMYSWWFKRNDNHDPSGCQEDYDITKWGAYYIVPTKEKRMYLTFDCGYENGYTGDLLDVLKKEKVPAAFFVTKTFIRDNIDLVKRMKEEGHLVCNHTVHHPTMPNISVEEQKKEILECEDYMKAATGYEMDLYFRPPKGEYSKRTLQIAKDLGYTTIFWSMAYLDYDVKKQPTVEHVIQHFEKYYHPGAIPLLHNVSKANHDALQVILQNLMEQGYSFGNLNEIKK